jgi:hypothetical protein
MSTLTTPSVDQLKRALSIAQEIDKLQSELGAILGDQPAKVASVPAKRAKAAAPVTRKGKRTMSPEARERIAAAQRARWSKARGESSASSSNGEESPKGKPAKAKKRTISPEGRARIAEAAKRRWAKQRQSAS